MKVSRDSIASLAACLLLAAMPGCSMFDGDSSSDHGSETLASGEKIPSGARLVADGTGPLDYTATADGTVYVQDATTRTTVASGRVDKGDRVRVEFDEDRVRIGDKTAYSGNLERDNKHRIYFVKSS
jgi:hypothetical protein